MTFIAFAGLVASVFTAALSSFKLSGRTKYFLYLGVVAFLTVVGYVFELFPGTWDAVGAHLAGILAVGQAVYGLFKPQLENLYRNAK